MNVQIKKVFCGVEGGQFCQFFAHQNKVILSRNNLCIAADKNQTAHGTTLYYITKSILEKEEKKAVIVLRVQIEKSLTVIGLPFFLLYLSRGRGTCLNMCTDSHVF